MQVTDSLPPSGINPLRRSGKPPLKNDSEVQEKTLDDESLREPNRRVPRIPADASDTLESSPDAESIKDEYLRSRNLDKAYRLEEAEINQLTEAANSTLSDENVPDSQADNAIEQPSSQQITRIARSTHERAGIAASLLEAFSKSRLSLVIEALKISDLPCYAWIDRHRDGIELLTMRILYGLDDDVISHVIIKDLPRAARVNRSPHRQYGENLTANQLEELLDAMETYTTFPATREDNDFAAQVDKAFNATSAAWTEDLSYQGGRKYLT
ncbi:MAG: hypothetical protein M1818_003513 [Claussenomyces sp. TS43310]|nr:MAG: hypothetical protein M1818_003513 [Claussenomyces sp. TS43310]